MKVLVLVVAAGAVLLAAGCAPALGGTGRPVPPTAAVTGATITATAAPHASPPAAATCRSSFFDALREVAAATLPVKTTEVDVAERNPISAADFRQLAGVGAGPIELEAAFGGLARAGDPLTATLRDTALPAWTFSLSGQDAQARWTEDHLRGPALAGLQRFNLGQPGGMARVTLGFPAGPLKGSPSLAGYLNQLAAAIASGSTGIDLVAGEVLQPPPPHYLAYWGPINLQAITRPGAPEALCGAWQARTVTTYQEGALVAAPAEMASIGNGGFVGFADNQFVVESDHIGVDTFRFYAVPNLSLPPQ